jgi:Fe-S cluster assembly iron-binding protein IscA
MLTITPAASAAIVNLLQSPTVPDGAGLRITHGPVTDETVAIGMSVVEEPDPSDQVVPAADGADVYVEPEAAELLDRQELDVEIDADRVVFSFHPQGVNGGSPGPLSA